MDESFDTLLSGRTAVIIALEAIQTMHLHKVLARAGMQVLASVATEEGMRNIVAGRQPDFILIDIDVLTGDNPELRPDALTELNSYLILLSHLPEPQNHALVSLWGANGFLTKPVGREQIIACLQEVARSQS